ncbi:MAG TPA: hypothetical protein EYQ17_00605 [Candidatus Marinimicrobia bacterium]|nr:hypothetical protein [Candidatus Neomarinimicrobiota bacterium]
MKLILIISFICFFGLPFTPWWMLWVVLGVCGWFATTPKEAMNMGAKVATLTWGIKIGSEFFTGGSILMQRVADMMGLGSSIGLVIATLVLVVFLGGISTMSGYQLKMLFLPPATSPKNM